MPALVFVTMELSPFTAGGIGRVLHNMFVTMSEEDRTRAIVLVVDAHVPPKDFNSHFPGVRLLQVDTTQDPPRRRGGRHVPPRSAFSDTRWHWRSACVMLALEKLAQKTPIEYVEFPDWGGLGFCTLQERRLAGLLQQACLAVRLHSTHMVLLSAEAHPIDSEGLNICDLERKCLRDCDRVVAQLPKIADTVREAMGFPADEWDHRVVVHAPPVVLSHHPPAAETNSASSTQSLMFTSKIQRFKRPDLFVRGVSAYMRTHPAYHGQARLQAARPDPLYVEKIDALIPADLSGRFEQMPHLPSEAREAAIAKATVIVPSNYESFCLAAYEASLLGARVILNAQNPAFDETSPWRDGVNCFKFDGTARGLTAAIDRNFSWTAPLVPVRLRNDPWPWAGWQPPTFDSLAKPSTPEPLVSVVVAHHNLGRYLCETLDNILCIKHRNLEIVVVDDASTDPGSADVINMLARLDVRRLKVLRLPGNVGLAAARNIGVQHAIGDYLLMLDSDDLIDPNFVARAVQALERCPEFDVVVTPAIYFPDGQSPSLNSASDPSDASDYAVFTGEARSAGVLENRFSTATALFRRSVLERFRYDENLMCYEDWSLYMRMCDGGVRFLVTTDAFFYYRRRGDSMVHRPRTALERHIDYSDLLRTSAPASIRRGSMHLMLGLGPTFTKRDQSEIPREGAQTQLDELLHLATHLEQILQSVQYATTPLAQVFRVPRYFWRRMLPLRRRIARLRGRA